MGMSVVLTRSRISGFGQLSGLICFEYVRRRAAVRHAQRHTRRARRHNTPRPLAGNFPVPRPCADTVLLVLFHRILA